MEGKYLFFDCETTGLRSSDEITQLALIGVDKNLKVVSCKNLYFDVDTIISEEVFNITKMDNATLKKLSKGQKFKDRVDDVISWFDGKIVIGHNVEFDIKMIRNSVLRCGKEIHLDSKICTMNRYINLMKLQGGIDGGFKNPNLGELTRFALEERKETNEDLTKHFNDLFGGGSNDNFHDALYDTFVTYYSFLTLK